MTPFRVEKKQLLDLKTTEIFSGSPQPCNMAGVPSGRNLVAKIERGSKTAFVYCPNIVDAQDIWTHDYHRDTILSWFTAEFSSNIQMKQLNSLSDMFKKW